jgi:hypothetical protein
MPQARVNWYAHNRRKEIGIKKWRLKLESVLIDILKSCSEVLSHVCKGKKGPKISRRIVAMQIEKFLPHAFMQNLRHLS